MSSSVQESVFEFGIEYSQANVLLMSLMEETHEDEYYGDDKLVSMIQSLEAEISAPQMLYEDNQDCSPSIIGLDHWVDMELISTTPFDEMNTWIPCGDHEVEHVAMEYEIEAENIIDDFQMNCGVFFEQQYRETYLSQGSSDAVF